LGDPNRATAAVWVFHTVVDDVVASARKDLSVFRRVKTRVVQQIAEHIATDSFTFGDTTRKHEDASRRRVTVCGYLVIVVRDQPAGPFNFGRTWIELDQIAVHHACRRRGIARSLVAAALAHADAAGIRDVELTSWSFNEEAHRAFRELGFVPKVVRFELSSRTRLP
jgi:ribosomal protein S18 acetylase RimI-like enzyme